MWWSCGTHGWQVDPINFGNEEDDGTRMEGSSNDDDGDDGPPVKLQISSVSVLAPTPRWKTCKSSPKYYPKITTIYSLLSKTCTTNYANSQSNAPPTARPSSPYPATWAVPENWAPSASSSR